jgi:hypothetical protein
MRKLITALLLLIPYAAVADQMTAGDLYSFCSARDEMQRTACRFYILGTFQGLALGSGSVVGNKGIMTSRDHPDFCLADETSQTQIVAVFVKHMQAVAQVYPQDLKLPAVSVLGAVMVRSFPCPKR